MLKTNFKQQQFIIYELQLPYCTVCTPSGGLTEAWHTPVTCDEASDETYSLWFTDNAAPIMSPPSISINIKSPLNSSVWRVVANGSETTPRLKPGEGMASRGTMSISLNDFEGDPGPINFSDTGTFFGKLKARNVLDGKKIISHNYSISSISTGPELVGSSTHFIENASLTGGKFTITAKDALKDLEAFGQKFPIPTEATLTADINATTTTIPVSDGSLYAAENVIIIDEELMRIQSIASNNLTVYTRGSDYLAGDGATIYKTDTSTHKEDATAQICYTMSKTFLSNILQDIFNAVNLSAYVDFTQWDDEISEWNASAWLYGVFHEPTDADKIINLLLTEYMIDLWLDQDTQKAKVSATTAWKQSIRTIVEGNDLTNLRTATRANTRFSRAYIRNDKDYQAKNDDSTNYSRFTIYKDTVTEGDDLYGSIKVKEFDPSNTITPDSAFILVSRYVQRFARTPEQLTFKMEERKLAGSNLGDVVDIVTRDSQTAGGEYLESKVRAQLIEVRPNLNEVGRTYNVTALSYVPLIATGGDLVIFISGTVFDVNLYARAGAPPDAIDVTFVFDGAIVGSTSNAIPSIRAGAFDPASNIKLIFTNSTKVSAKGGAGGGSYVDNRGKTGFFPGLLNVSTTSATDGGDSYQSDGIATEIYINYGTVDGYVTDSDVFAAGGGGSGVAGITIGGASAAGSPFECAWAGAGSGGAGGSGIPGGVGGIATKHIDSHVDSTTIISGIDGSFVSGGAGVVAISTDSGANPSGTHEVKSTATSGAGGASIDGSASTFLAEIIIDSGNGYYSIESLGSEGDAGGAIKGANVTVYNLAADSARFKQGNSDSFTLVTA